MTVAEVGVIVIAITGGMAVLTLIVHCSFGVYAHTAVVKNMVISSNFTANAPKRCR
jgi:hypothetical protein